MKTVLYVMQNLADAYPRDLRVLNHLGFVSAGQITPLGRRFMAGALTEGDTKHLRELMQDQCADPNPEWVTKAPHRSGRVFGPASGCGECASTSMGF